MISQFWDKRYTPDEYLFGKQPNVFFKSVIDTLPPGKIFIPGAGEGRDAVYAATIGWEVTCIDLSTAGKEKALRLADEYNVSINYEIKNIIDVEFSEYQFDAIASIFFHLPIVIRIVFYKKVIKWLKTGGLFIAESFTPLQLQNTSGGPNEIDMLVTSTILATELTGLEIMRNSEEKTILAEGKGHVGKANVVQFIGKKSKNKL